MNSMIANNYISNTAQLFSHSERYFSYHDINKFLLKVTLKVR